MLSLYMILWVDWAWSCVQE